jgi:hypothetical protein
MTSPAFIKPSHRSFARRKNRGYTRFRQAETTRIQRQSATHRPSFRNEAPFAAHAVGETRKDQRHLHARRKDFQEQVSSPTEEMPPERALPAIMVPASRSVGGTPERETIRLPLSASHPPRIGGILWNSDAARRHCTTPSGPGVLVGVKIAMLIRHRFMPLSMMDHGGTTERSPRLTILGPTVMNQPCALHSPPAAATRRA